MQMFDVGKLSDHAEVQQQRQPRNPFYNER